MSDEIPTPMCDHFADMDYHHMAADELLRDWMAGNADRSAATKELYALARAAFAAARALREADDTVAAEGDLFRELGFQQCFGGWVRDKFDADRHDIRAMPTTEEDDR
ncbi:hypothetical protein GCM10023224_05650 [Streptomonospora halophila]|uniref:Uncharacterized protein n=1 Tax=Streptomonospora halophila TaxID=427369 RepID=A0ABP9G607_9ACTN